MVSSLDIPDDWGLSGKVAIVTGGGSGVRRVWRFFRSPRNSLRFGTGISAPFGVFCFCGSCLLIA